ncbi:L,D-transpeptidase family protein [Streptomyces sp. NPDC059850]|uniref:L,D-transpeptidase family protein n=1 Tax=Streptomyces sp. NPDC059850 TaxID=3346970 RepID=UPI00365C478A
MRVRIPAVATALLIAALAGCAGPGDGSRKHTTDDAKGTADAKGSAGRSGAAGAPTGTQSPAGRPAPAERAGDLPGLGPRTRADVPRDAEQVVVVTGSGRDATRSSVVLYERSAAGGTTGDREGDAGGGPVWRAGPSWKAHNAARGWTDHHRQGDLRSPTGVFRLSDGGGKLPDPGTKLTYDHAVQGFTISGTGAEGEPLAGAFDYVVAINYNREAGTSPRDWTRPLGDDRGGGIWFHVDHNGPTQGCISLSRAHMRTLLRTLDPDRHPVVVMGPEDSLAR